ncbi:uncharacterized protein LY89DRAFT_714400 [Mollisia scopiformis]|uniref:Uncharacterized protein n=1 Tax=Mollisia scopiformis TaxID=149040 RepID=A0A194XRH6_MOLSC|nr:uncharacterized protein LY89DRAFT_714400 [Mollisia scopiformis]KUJ22654.1 hypothetical protein LY89DRAFT_714400 [Mollisia scopiformis]
MTTIGIEGVYRVYMKWSDQADAGLNTLLGRWQLVFRNRQTADEYFRFLTSLTDPTGKYPLFNFLTRNGPQFWYYDVTQYAGSNWEFPRLVLVANTEWGTKVMISLENDGGGRGFDVIPTQATTEWINGGAYFIKNTNLPTEYWKEDGGLITISDTERTKFVVRATAFLSSDPQVLIRTDKITIELAADASTSDPQYLTLPSGTSRLGLSSEPYTWTFNDFFATLAIEGYTASSGTYYRVINNSPGTSIVWDLV